MVGSRDENEVVAQINTVNRSTRDSINKSGKQNSSSSSIKSGLNKYIAAAISSKESSTFKAGQRMGRGSSEELDKQSSEQNKADRQATPKASTQSSSSPTSTDTTPTQTQTTTNTSNSTKGYIGKLGSNGASGNNKDGGSERKKSGSSLGAAAAAKPKESREEMFKKFEAEGVQFKAKLVGSELVIEPRGDKICQDSIKRLKAIIKGQKAHKRRILMRISYDGVKVIDEKTNELIYHNEVPQISFIASDDSDARTFGYICDVPNKAHRFICFKTLGPAVQVMSVISTLFEAVLERKSQQAAAQTQASQPETGPPEVLEGGPELVDSAELIETDVRETSDGPEGEQSGARTPPAARDYFELDQLELAEDSGSAVGSGLGARLGADFSSRMPGKQKDLFSGQLEELFMVSAAPPLASDSATAGNELYATLEERFQLEAAGQPQTVLGGRQGSLVKQSTLKEEHRMEQRMEREAGSSASLAGDSGLVLDSPSSATQAEWGPVGAPRHTPSRPINLPRPAAGGERPLAAPPSRGHLRLLAGHSLGSSASGGGASGGGGSGSLGAAEESPDGQAKGGGRSLVYNHSSVSLNDAALTRQCSFGGLPMGAQRRLASSAETDKYAVFNDIDNLPSIFESSTSLNGSACSPQTPVAPTLPAPQATSSQVSSPRERFDESGAPAALFFGGAPADPFGQLAGQPQAAAPLFGASIAGQAPSSHFRQQPATAGPHALFNQPNRFHLEPQAVTPSIPIDPQRLPFGPFEAGPSHAPPGTPFGQLPLGPPLPERGRGSASGGGLESMVVGSAPMTGLHGPAGLANKGQPNLQGAVSAQMAQAHARFSSSMMAGGLSQRLGSSAASLKSTGSATGLSRQTNPFDDEFFS